MNDDVRALAVSGSDLYVGGEFTQTGDGSLTNLGNIAHGTSAAPEPEIQVLDGTTDIPDGTGSINFGTTTVGMPINKTFTVKNTGTANLSLTEPIAVPTGFSVASSFGSTTLAPGNSTTFTVRLDAIAAGTYSGTLQFANNDADENPFDLTINGDACGANTPPTISGLPDQTVPVNGSADNAIDLWDYADDAESPDSDLTFTIDNTPDPNAGVSIDSNRYIDINPTLDWEGQTNVTIRVTDPGGLSDTNSFQVIVEPPEVPPVITSITPNSGNNNEVVHITNLAGSDFQSGAAVRLIKTGQADIVAINPVVVVSTSITCDFDLRGASPGQWTVRVTNPDTGYAEKENGFTVKGLVFLPIVLK